MNNLTTRMPTVEEVLAGETQGGVARPIFSMHPDDAQPRDSRDFTRRQAAATPSATRTTGLKGLWRRVKGGLA